MSLSSKEILKFIKAKSAHPMKMKELAKALNISKKDYSVFRNKVKSLIEQGELVKLRRGKIAIISEMDIIVDKISVNRSGVGFVPSDKDDQDILIPNTGLHTALNGDKVMIRLGGYSGGRKTGTVIRVVERLDRNIVGVFHRSRNFSYVVPDDRKLHRDIYIPDKFTQKAKEGEKVVVCLVDWDDPHLNPEGKITECLGFPGEPGVDLLTIIKSHNLPEKFTEDVISEATQLAVMPDKNKLTDRVDLISDDIYTIDPADAKDYDDAISVKKNSNGYSLGVHIADVSYFVPEGSLLDKEALRRGNSVYLPGMVIPMLPENLSNDICSLRPNRIRLAHSVSIDFDKKGKMIRWKIFDSIIKSKAKLNYEEVQDFYNGKSAGKAIKRVEKNLKNARELAQILNKRRFSKGSLDFDLPEVKITLNKKGEVIELGNRVRLESHRLVEEFMLAANKAVAREVSKLGQQFLYRVHEKPSIEKAQEFSDMMKRLGYKFPVSPTMKPKQFANFLNRIKGVPEEDFINELMLRSMQKAVYQRKNAGHFGLSFLHYSHFTSPIRRYPDLLVHRLLRKLKKGHYPIAYSKKVNFIIDSVGAHCSETERVAESAERDAIKVKQVSFMAKHIGEKFSGIISGVIGYGFFVRLNNLGAEGMVRVSSLDNDYYNFDEKQYRFIGKRTGQIYRLGDKVEVKVLSVDKLRGEINFAPIKSNSPRNKKKKRRRK
ncbi:MAG: ribonuclease R [candidate division Zixibacteria bacterium]|nr:ribonuclease R [candidate division Zixibacteria bacterium]